MMKLGRDRLIEAHRGRRAIREFEERAHTELATGAIFPATCP